MDLTEAFTEAITGDTVPPPQTGAELVSYAGGAPALARLDAGLSAAGRLPRKDTEPDARRKYEAAKRRFQRWAAPPGKQRTKNPSPTVVHELRRRVIIARKFPLIPESRRLGARARIKAWVMVDSPKPGRVDRRLRTLPSGGPGQELDAATMRRLTDKFTVGDANGAADDFLDAFLAAYGFGEAEIEDIHEITVWPDATPEP